jgi:hypothetical protein
LYESQIGLVSKALPWSVPWQFSEPRSQAASSRSEWRV